MYMYLWGMPMMKLSTPRRLDWSIIVLSAGMRTSQPSSPKRFSLGHLLARNSSNLPADQSDLAHRGRWGDDRTHFVALTSRASKILFSSSVMFMASGVSKNPLIQSPDRHTYNTSLLPRGTPTNCSISDVHVFHSNVLAVDVLESLDNVPQG